MREIIQLLTDYGLLLVFASVFVEQIGLPLPALPVLLVVGALAVGGSFSVWLALGLGLVSCLLADGLWYYTGRRFGFRVLRTLCRISLSPDSCVRQSEFVFARWGAGALVAAKFIPGLSTIAPPMAGATGRGWASFLLFDGIGSILWVGACLGAGWLCHAQIDGIIGWLVRLGTIATLLLFVLLTVYLGVKWRDRQRFFQLLRMARISVDELYRLIDRGANPIIVDVRSSGARAIDRRLIPGALLVGLDDLGVHLGHLPLDSEIVLYCACPNEASAAHVARQLMNLGFKRVRPLEGGLDAWAAAGHPIIQVS